MFEALTRKVGQVDFGKEKCSEHFLLAQLVIIVLILKYSCFCHYFLFTGLHSSINIKNGVSPFGEQIFSKHFLLAVFIIMIVDFKCAFFVISFLLLDYV